MNAQLVHEEKNFVAFRDINPQAPTHVLIIPKQHIPSISDCHLEHASLIAEMMLGAKAIAKKEGLDDGGYRIVVNKGANAGQTVFHLHFHLLGGRMFTWPPG